MEIYVVQVFFQNPESLRVPAAILSSSLRHPFFLIQKYRELLQQSVSWVLRIMLFSFLLVLSSFLLFFRETLAQKGILSRAFLANLAFLSSTI